MYLSNLVDVLWLLSVMVFFNIVKKVVQALLSLTIKEAPFLALDKKFSWPT